MNNQQFEIIIYLHTKLFTQLSLCQASIFRLFSTPNHKKALGTISTVKKVIPMGFKDRNCKNGRRRVNNIFCPLINYSTMTDISL